ncbi:MAG: penicillin-binding transpeptidase domain-containing protein [Acidimicrobiales bacterium]
MRRTRGIHRCGLGLTFALLLAACGGGAADDPDRAGTAPASTAGSADAVSGDTADADPAAPRDAPAALEAYVAAWETGDWSTIQTLVNDPALGADAIHRNVWETLGVRSTSIEIVGDVDAGAAEETGTVAVRLEVNVELDQIGPWTYPTEVTVVRSGDQWVVAWAPATVHPALVDGRRLVAQRQWPPRGALLGADGTALRVERPVVSVGIEPQRITDRDRLLTRLETILDVPADEVATSLDAPGVQPDWFVPVTVLDDDVAPLTRAALEGLDGVVLRETSQRLAPTRRYARQVLGETGPITAELLADWGPPYQAGDVVGLSGLELAFERELAGSPGGDVRVVDADGELVAVLHRLRGAEPVDVVTTIDPATQEAAEAALDGVTEPVALVAIDAASGEVRAVVSRPIDEFGRAFGGAYPPGSTFKIVTTAAALQAGLSPGSPAPCPAETFLGGLRFTNAGGADLGAVDLATSLAASCNTAFVDLVAELGAESLADAAAQFGVGVDLDTGLGATGIALPEPIDDAELGAHAIGQGRVTVSPLAMASVAAAVADGTWREPVLVTEPAGPEPETRSLDDGVAEALRTMMRGVVTGGTAAAGLGQVPGEVIAKTGSAEFAGGDPPPTHAWVIGARDGLAFAVVVEGGGAGGAVAAPIAAAFLTALG